MVVRFSDWAEFIDIAFLGINYWCSCRVTILKWMPFFTVPLIVFNKARSQIKFNSENVLVIVNFVVERKNTFYSQDTYRLEAACAADAACRAACDTTGLDVGIDTANVSLFIWYRYVKAKSFTVSFSLSRQSMLPDHY